MFRFYNLYVTNFFVSGKKVIVTMLTSQNCQRNKLNIYDELNNYILQWSKEDIAEIYQAVKVYDKLLGRKNNREDFITFTTMFHLINY